MDMDIAIAGVAVPLPVVIAAALVVVTIIFFATGGSPEPFLKKNHKKRVSVPLKERIQLSHDTVLFRFGLPSPNMSLGLDVGNHVRLFCPNSQGTVAGQWNGREDPEAKEAEIERKYTPTTLNKHKGYFDLVIKVYKAGVLEQFPDGGKMSQYLDSLKVGDSVDMEGPFGMIKYLGNGSFGYGRKELKKKHVGMLAGGTGITPMLQIVASILDDPSDPTKVSLIYANKTEDDILVRDMLESLRAKHPDRFDLWYTLDNPPKGWKYSKGFITADMIKDHLPGPGADTLVLMCGPPPMVKFACKQNLDALGYEKPDQLAF